MISLFLIASSAVIIFPGPRLNLSWFEDEDEDAVAPPLFLLSVFGTLGLLAVYERPALTGVLSCPEGLYLVGIILMLSAWRM